MKGKPAVILVIVCGVCLAQQMSDSSMYLMNMSSGTSMNPQSWAMPMVMSNIRSWQTMFMAQAFLVDTQQSGPRGHDKLYAPNWGMASAMHSLASGTLAINAMLSLEPATVTSRRYPELFQTGETAYGKPLVDAQHPHDFVMALGFDYVHPLGGAMLQFYYAPVGDPALGPVAFPHRASAFELPQATLSHHWQDSTHIADNVATVAVAAKWLRLEASGFYGTEPNENRWNIDWGPMNSYAGRISVMPSNNWTFQFSAGRITQPERGEPGDVVRATASLQYTRWAKSGQWSSSLIWGRNHETATHHNVNSYLAETVYPVSKRDFLTGRIEIVDKDELQMGPPGSTFRVHAYTAGFTHDVGTFWRMETGMGANVTAYAIPAAIQPFYGEHPVGVDVYLRFRLRQGK
jgi:hypothetical protein